MIAAELELHPDADLLFSDEDKIDEHGNRRDPYFKPDFNHELLLGHNCISHLGVYRHSLVEAIGGFRVGFDGSQDYDLALRTIARTERARIRHLPFVLYHWRVFERSNSFSTDHHDTALGAARRAITEHLEERGERVEVVAAPTCNFQRVRRPLPQPAPRVSIVIPTRDNALLLEQCMRGILQTTHYPNFEVLVVDNESRDPAALEHLHALEAEPRVRVLRAPGPFNFSAINNGAVAQASGEVLCLLNDDIEVIHADWLSEMVALAAQARAGAVGARLLFPDGTVQHGGIILGVLGVAAHLHRSQPADAPGYFGRLQLSQELSAVTAACLVVRRQVFDEVGGFNEQDLAVAFNDVDLCLRIREAGYVNLWTPHATLHHRESASRASDLSPTQQARFAREVDYMKRRWRDALANDPNYSPNLTLEGTDLGLAFPPRVRRPWLSESPPD
jgi:GT2 family glycosyltransferase